MAVSLCEMALMGQGLHKSKEFLFILENIPAFSVWSESYSFFLLIGRHNHFHLALNYNKIFILCFQKMWDFALTDIIITAMPVHNNSNPVQVSYTNISIYHPYQGFPDSSIIFTEFHNGFQHLILKKP